MNAVVWLYVHSAAKAANAASQSNTIVHTGKNISFTEFQIVKLAFLSPAVDTSKAGEKHYLPIVDAIRRAFNDGKTPEQIRRIFRKRLQPKSPF